MTSCEIIDDIFKSEPEPDASYGELIDVTLTGSSSSSTRVSYEPNSDNSVYAFSWEAGDEVSVIVPGAEGNGNQKFTTSSSAATSALDGQLATWSGEQTLYAVYPYSQSGYTLTSGSLFYDNTSQAVDAQSGNSYENGLMVVAVSGATASSADQYSIPSLSFAQVMAFFELELCDIPSGETVTSIGLSTTLESFVVSADVDLASGAITPRTYSSSVNAEVVNQSGSTASLNLAVLPVNLSGQNITISVSTISATESKKYTYEIAGGANFAFNNFMYNDGGELSLSDDFTSAGTGILYLADFDGGFIPSGDTWVIADSEATSGQFLGLTSALVTAASSSREITIEFPYLGAIPNDAFYNSTSTSVTALVSFSAPLATTIGNNAFRSCSKLTSLYFPKAEVLNEYAFYGCTSLTSVNFPEATTIGSRAFFYCPLLASVDFPEATTIGEYAFSGCSSLTSVDFPEATTIGEYAFDSCSSLTSVDFPEATTIGEYAFYERSSLTSVNFPEATTIGEYAFYKCSSLTSIDFPEVTNIGGYAFKWCTSLTSADFPEATTIGEYAFIGCSSLASVDFSETTTIGEYAFYYCTSLTSADFPEATTIGRYAFQYCKSLTSVNFPKATTIGSEAFSGCSSLTSADFPEATTIGETAFCKCSSLTSADFPEVTTIVYHAFSGCSSLTSANFPKATTIEQQAFYQCSSLTSADFPEATTIERYAFSGCSKLSSVNFPLVTSIGYYYKSSSAGYAFEGCVSLKSAAFPSVTAIYQYTFYGCDALTSLDLATNEDCVLSTLDVDVFRINDTQTQEGNITLNIGTANSSNVSGNTLTVSGNSYTFSKINVTGGSQSELTASSPNGNGVAW